MRTHSSLSARLLNHPAARYGLALLAAAFAFLAQWALRDILHVYNPYLALIAAIGFSAWYCVLLPSILTVIVSTVAARYWFIRPLHSFEITSFEQAIGRITFLLVSGLLILMGEARRPDNEILQRAHADLENRVQQRTAELNAANRSLRELSARLMQLQDDERRRIARELHDSVGQMLVALGMNLSTVKADWSGSAKPSAPLLTVLLWSMISTQRSAQFRIFCILLCWMRQVLHQLFGGIRMDSPSAVRSKSI